MVLVFHLFVLAVPFWDENPSRLAYVLGIARSLPESGGGPALKANRFAAFCQCLSDGSGGGQFPQVTKPFRTAPVTGGAVYQVLTTGGYSELENDIRA
jgi:hypothetical protein